MPWITIDEARENLRMWLEAEKTVAVKGQSYRIGTRSLTHYNLSEIAERIRFWRGEVDSLEAQEAGRGAGRRVQRGLPRDF